MQSGHRAGGDLYLWRIGVRGATWTGVMNLLLSLILFARRTSASSSMKYTSAKDVMTSDVKTVGADWPLDRVAEFLIEHDISGAPVVDGDTLVGVISLTDLARHDSVSGNRTSSDRPAAYYRNELEHLYAEEEVDQLRVREGDETTARDVMTDEIYDVNAHTSVQQIAQVMHRGRIHRVFVTTDGEIRGVISALDMLKVVAEA